MSKKNKKKRQSSLQKAPASTAPAKGPGFIAFVFRDRRNRSLFLSACGIYIVLFFVFKYALPMPDIFSDSHGYILAAAKNKEVFFRPFGYSRFLQLLRPFSYSPLFVAGFQYFLLAVASLFCYFTVHYLWGFTQWITRYGALWLMVANPAMLVLMNQVSSDALFSALTITWFTLLLWIVQRHSWWALLLQLVILYWAFTVRYNALYYPAIACLAFLLAPKASLHYRLAGILTTVLVIGSTYNQVKATTARDTGSEVFAGFSGWQMANNALYIYNHINVDTAIFEDPEIRLLDQYVKRYIDSLTSVSELEKIRQGKLAGSIFIWDTKSPLKLFAFEYARRYRMSYLKAWYHVAPMYHTYGSRIIMENPWTYFKYYVWNNISIFFVPELESMRAYDAGHTPVAVDTKQWFGIKEDKLTARYPQVQQWITLPFPYLHALLVVFCLTVPGLFWYGERKVKGAMGQDMLILILLWYAFFLLNMAFSISASIITLRYEMMWFILGLGLPLVFLDRMISNRKEFSKSKTMQP